MMDALDRKALEAHDHFLARRLVGLAWCYHRMTEQLSTSLYLSLPSDFFNVGMNLTLIADAMWQEHGDWAYAQRLADIEQVAGARYN